MNVVIGYFKKFNRQNIEFNNEIEYVLLIEN